MFKKRLLSSVVVSALVAGGSVNLYGKSFAMEEILVTARKRDENLQEVPESITVLTESIIRDNNVRNLQTLTDIVPNVTLHDSFRKGVIDLVVRGIGTPQFGEAPISFVVDGATVPDTDFINQGIFDVDNIQILRGPQGALYGRGALAGAILINTKQPTNDFSGNLQAGWQRGDDFTLSGAVSGPIVADKVLFRLGGYFNDRDGIIKNADGDLVDYVDGDYAVRGMLKFIPSDNLEIKITAKTADGDYGQSTQSPIAASDLNDNDAYKTVNTNYIGINEREINEYSAAVDWNLGFASLVSVTSWSDVDDILYADGDFAAVALFTQVIANQKEGLTQELRLVSPDDKAFRWIVGAFYQEREWNYQFEFLADPGDDSKPFFNQSNPSGFDIDSNSDSIGFFVSTGWDITEALEVTAALRYDKDERDYINYVVETERRDAEFSQLQPKVSLAYQLTDDVLAYASYSSGFRTGGFNSSIYSFQPFGYDEQVSDSYELGIKSSWLDNRLMLNGALFTTDAENYQLTRFDPVSFTIGNQTLEDVSIQGLELELQAQPVENLVLSAAYGYTDSEIDSFDGTGGAEDMLFSGNKVPFNPRHSFNASARYTMALRDGYDLISYVSYRQLGRTFWEPDNLHMSETHNFVNVRLTLEAQHFSVAAFANNVFDERQAESLFSNGPGAIVVTPNTPRSYGVEVRYEF